MAKDLTLALRTAAITLLQESSGLTARVPAGQIYGMRQPATTEWPFTRYGSPDAGKVGKGSQIDFSVHAFSKAAFDDECAAICAEIVEVLDEAILNLPDGGGARAQVAWRRTQIIPDAAEASAWHGIVQLRAVIVGC